MSLERVEALIAEIDATADPNVRAAARELVQTLMQFHGEAVGRMLDLAGATAAQAMGRDELVRPMLLLYDLHPESTEVRVRRVVDRMRNVELAALEDLDVRIRVTGNGVAPSREEIEAAIQEAAPEVRSISIEGLRTPDFVPLAQLAAS